MEEQIKQTNPTLHKYLFTVTTFSKFLAMILFIALPFVGFYLGMQYQQKITVASPVILETQKKPISSPTPTTTANWKTYTDSQYGYMLNYPASAKVVEASSNDLASQFGNPVKQTTFSLGENNFYHFYWVHVYPSKGELNVQNWIRKYEANGTEVTLSDYPMVNLSAKYAKDLVGGIYDREGVYILKGNYVYSIIASASSINTIRGEFDQILSTFKLTQ